MRDVAEEAGVSLATVSRVVNGHESVKPSTSAAVRAVIDRLGFQRDEIARSLRPSQTSRTIGLLLGDLTNPFYAGLAKAIVTVLGDHGYSVLLGTADEDPDTQRRAVGDLLGRRVAGLMIVPDQSDHAYLHRTNRFDLVPVVFLDRPGAGDDSDVVVLANQRGGRMAVEHLISRGHTRIATIVAPSYYTTKLRLQGYKRALKDAGLPVLDELIITLSHGSTEEARLATQALLARPDAPTAIFSTTSFLTEGVLRGMAASAGRVALVGFDDFPMADMLPTPVTVVTSETADMGRKAAELLLGRLDGDDSPARRIVLPVELVTRGSGELPVPS
ncbi:LacI family transcriptional regulator (plasmid) [Frondihabitans sp. PAMC 28766]|nr:LacI family transcriptional regulator [Frondihabitans sp. PAMC 28766]